MKKTGLFRMLALLLTLLMSVGLMPVYAEEEPIPMTLQEWRGASLQQAAAQTGVTNPAGNPIFTTYEELVGIRQQQGILGNVMVHSMYMPVKYRMEDTLLLTVRLYAGEEASGTVCWADMIYDAIGSGDAYDFKLEIDAPTYNAASTCTDAVLGYSYREFTLAANLDDTIYDMDEKSFQLRFYNFGLADLTLYSMEVYNETTGEEVYTANPYALYKADHLSPVEKVTIPAGDDSGIVTYSGPECFPQRPQANAEPYAKYNCDGMGNRALLLEVGRELYEGQYEFALDFATCYTLVKGDRAIFELIRCAGQDEEVVWSHVYTHEEAAERLGSVDYVDTEGMYDRYLIPVEVSAEQAGATYALRIYATNYSDVYVRGVTMSEMVSASLASVRAVEVQIDALPAVGDLTLSSASKVAAARAALEALTAEQQALVSNRAALEAAEEQIGMLQKAWESARAVAAKAVIEAIDAIGVVDESNYMAKKEFIDVAVAALEEYEEAYGSDSETAALITNRPVLTDAQEAWNRLSDRALYGDIDGNGSINANDALLALQHSVNLTSLSGNAARAADVDFDGKIDASDALLILQYSVGLINKFPVEKQQLPSQPIDS